MCEMFLILAEYEVGVENVNMTTYVVCVKSYFESP